MADIEPGSQPLKGKRELFAHAVVKLNDQAKAYREVYNVGKNTKPETIWQAASRVSNDSKVSARVNWLRAQVAAGAVVDAQWVLNRLAVLASADIRTLLNDDGTVKDVSKWTDDASSTVAGITVSEIADGTGLIKSIKRVDQLKALELLGKHKAVQAFRDQIEISASEELASAIVAARKRAASGE